MPYKKKTKLQKSRFGKTLHISHGLLTVLLIAIVELQVVIVGYVAWRGNASAYDPNPYCLYHILGSLYGDYGGNGYNWNSQRTTWNGWSNGDAAVSGRFKSCAQTMAANPAAYSLYASPAPSVTINANGADLVNFHFTFDFPFDTLPAPVANGSFYQKRAFLMSVVEGEGQAGAAGRGKLLDETHCLDGGTKCADGYAQHVMSVKQVADALHLSTYYTKGNCNNGAPENCTPLSEGQLTSYGTVELHISDNDLAIHKINAWPFASYARVPGGQYYADTTPPIATLTAPAANATVAGTIDINASVADPNNMGVQRVDFYVNDGIVVSDTSAPYSYGFNTRTKGDGSYTFKAVALDYNDASTNAAVTATIKNTVDTPPPTTQPPTDGGNNGTPGSGGGGGNSSPPPTSSGSGGNSSSPVVVDSATGQRLTVATNPNQSVSNLVTLNPELTDPAKAAEVVKVTYTIDGKYYTSVTAAPFALDTRGLKNGSHSVLAEVTYKDGTKTTKTTTINVKNAAKRSFSGVRAAIILVCILCTLILVVVGFVFGRHWLETLTVFWHWHFY